MRHLLNEKQLVVFNDLEPELQLQVEPLIEEWLLLTNGIVYQMSGQVNYVYQDIDTLDPTIVDTIEEKVLFIDNLKVKFKLVPRFPYNPVSNTKPYSDVATYVFDDSDQLSPYEYVYILKQGEIEFINKSPQKKRFCERIYYFEHMVSELSCPLSAWGFFSSIYYS